MPTDHSTLYICSSGFDSCCVCRQVRRPNQAVAIQFKVGDVVRHRRYHYRGVIYGWDPECKAEEDWMLQMRIDQLPGVTWLVQSLVSCRLLTTLLERVMITCPSY